MNLCIKDLYLFFITIILFYISCKIYKIEKKNNEKFDSISDTKVLINQVYNADIEAIRNLSSIASKLIKEGGLVVPGKLQVTDTLTAKALYSSGGTGAGTGTHFPWTDGINYIGGNTKISNDLSVGGKLNLPNNTSLSADGDDATHWLRLQQTSNPAQYKSLAVKDLWCQAGDSVLYSTTIGNSGNATINGTLTAGKIIRRDVLHSRTFDIEANKLYLYDHNLGIPLHLLTIKVFGHEGNNAFNNFPGGRWDITGQLVNNGHQGYSIQDNGPNSFYIHSGNYVMVVKTNNCASTKCKYDVYII